MSTTFEFNKYNNCVRDLPTLFQAIDTAVWELGEAMTDFPDDQLWTRPHPKLLSTGEILAHLMNGEASVFLGPEFHHKCIIEECRYYPHNIESAFRIDIAPSEFYEEIKAVHEKCREAFHKMQPVSENKNPFRDQWTWGSALEYMAFHFAYHTGQIYSIRHILGHETVDN